MKAKICQSCGMPMVEEEHFGKNADGSKNEGYCCYCYLNGVFSKDKTLEEMIETCVPFMVQGGECRTEEEARKMHSIFGRYRDSPRNSSRKITK